MLKDKKDDNAFRPGHCQNLKYDGPDYIETDRCYVILLS